MNLFLILAFLFFIGSICGWVIELLFRRFISKANPERKWINPGFCTGPYIPLYGFGLCFLYLIARMEDFNLISNMILNRIVLFLAMAVCMTVIEYMAGVGCLHFANMRLWDYSQEWGNVNGLICPKFSLIWAALGAVYYFCIHPYILDALYWLGNNLAFSFFIGLFYGVFVIDVAHSINLTAKLRAFADDKELVIHYENLKAHIRQVQEQQAGKYHFFRPFHSELSVTEHLQEYFKELLEMHAANHVFGRRAVRK